MSLNPQTEERMRSFFAGKACCCCGFPAQRFSCNRYYCHDCVGNVRNVKPLVLREMKTYHPAGSSPNDPRRR